MGLSLKMVAGLTCTILKCASSSNTSPATPKSEFSTLKLSLFAFIFLASLIYCFKAKFYEKLNILVRHLESYENEGFVLQAISRVLTLLVNFTQDTKEDDSSKTQENDSSKTQENDSSKTQEDDSSKTQEDDCSEIQEDDCSEIQEDDSSETQEDEPSLIAPVLNQVDASEFTPESPVRINYTQKYKFRWGYLKGEHVVCKSLAQKDIGNALACSKFKASTNLTAKLEGGDGSIMEIIAVSDFDTNDPKVYMKAMANGDLEKRLFDENKPFSVVFGQEIALQVITGISIIHEKNLLHRNITASQVLLDENNKPKLSGLSNVRELSENMTMNVGDERYAAPEAIIQDDKKKQPYTEKADIYSFGLLCAAIHTRKCPYAHITGKTGKTLYDGPLAEKFRANEGNITVLPPDTEVDWFVELIYDCTRKEPERRPSALEIMARIKKHLYEKIPGSPGSPGSSTIDATVTIIEARNIANRKPFGPQSPLCQLSLGENTFVTKKHKRGGTYPKWNEEFKFPDVDLMNMTLDFTIKRATFWNDFIGRKSYELHKTLLEQTHTIPVNHYGDPHGELIFKIEFHGDVRGWLGNYIDNTQRYLNALNGRDTLQSIEARPKLAKARKILNKLQARRA